MVAEFDSETKTGNEIDDKDCIHFYWITTKDFIEHPHASHEFKKNKEDTETNDQSDWKTTKDLKGKNNSCNTKHSILRKDTSNVSVLIIINVEKRVSERIRSFSLGISKSVSCQTKLLSNLLKEGLREIILNLSFLSIKRDKFFRK